MLLPVPCSRFVVPAREELCYPVDLEIATFHNGGGGCSEEEIVGHCCNNAAIYCHKIRDTHPLVRHRALIRVQCSDAHGTMSCMWQALESIWDIWPIEEPISRSGRGELASRKKPTTE